MFTSEIKVISLYLNFISLFAIKKVITKKGRIFLVPVSSAVPAINIKQP